MSEIEQTVKDLAEQVMKLDALVKTVVSNFKLHAKEVNQFEQTIRNIDDNINSLKIQFAQGEMVRHREIENFVEPIWKSIRKLDDKYVSRRDARSHIALLWICVVTLSGFGLYILNDAEDDILRLQKENKQLITEHNHTNGK